MRCSVNSCDISDDRFLWKCEFCDKYYHAACVGVQRHQEHFISTYMIPLCADCQHHLKTGIDTRKVLCHQEQLIDSIRSQTDANLRIAADLKKVNAIGELFDNIELQLKELVTSVNSNTSSKVANAVSTISRDIENNSANKADEFVSVKNHLTTLFNISMETTRKRIEEYVSDLTADLSRELKAICSEVQNLSSITIDMAAHCNEHNATQSHPLSALEEVKSLANTVGGDILNEIKSLTSAINTLDGNVTNARLPLAMSPPSLMDELVEQSVTTATQGLRQNNDDEGSWRILGSKNVWRLDWTDYDMRKRRREQQQKAKDMATKRRKANKNNKKFSSINNNCTSYSRQTTTNNRTNNGSNNVSRNYNIPTCSYNYNSINNNQNRHQAVKGILPSDKDLLAAAKVTFSGQPVEHQRGIRFQRGEILNPYPDHQFPQANSTSTPHGPDLRNSFSLHCSSCSCERSCFRLT